MDRFLIKEELATGQHVRRFTVSVDGKVAFNGTAIGRTLIVRLPANITGRLVELDILGSHGPAAIRLFSVPNPASCSVTGGNGGSGCHLIPNTEYLGLVANQLTTGTVSACCAACATEPACAFFTAAPAAAATAPPGGRIAPFAAYTCKLMTAQQGSKLAPGVTSGSPTKIFD